MGDGDNELLDFCDRIFNDKNKKKELDPYQILRYFWWKLCKALFRTNGLKQNKVSSPFSQDFYSYKNSSFCKSIKNHFFVQLYVKMNSHQEIFGLDLKMS